MTSIERLAAACYRWHVRCTTLLLCVLIAACAARTVPPADPPSEPGRHRAALAFVSVANSTAVPLTIAFRSATPPLQEVVIGRAPAGELAQMAPVPAGEPIIMIARTADGSEFALPARSFALDAEWTWEIPRHANFTKPDRAN